MRTLITFTAFWTCLCFATLTAVRGAAPAVALLGEAQVQGESIYLSDLLAGESAAMREAARKIRVAAAPPPGGTVILAGAKVAGLLAGETLRGKMATDGAEGMFVPPQILVRRFGRRLGREEVVSAIFAALGANGIPEASGLRPEDIHFEAPVTVSSLDAKLEVRRMDFDPALRQARFLLASAADKRALPFLVTAGLRPEAPVDTARHTGSGAPPSVPVAGSGRAMFSRTAAAENDGRTAVDAVPPAAAVLMVEPKKPASLHVFSGSMQMYLGVLPLDRGALNETVRVRVPSTGRILRGRVIGPGQLEAQF